MFVGEFLEPIKYGAPETTRGRPNWSEVVRHEVNVELAMSGLASRTALEVMICDFPEDVRVLLLDLHTGEVG